MYQGSFQRSCKVYFYTYLKLYRHWILCSKNIDWHGTYLRTGTRIGDYSSVSSWPLLSPPLRLCPCQLYALGWRHKIKNKFRSFMNNSFLSLIACHWRYFMLTYYYLKQQRILDTAFCNTMQCNCNARGTVWTVCRLNIFQGAGKEKTWKVSRSVTVDIVETKHSLSHIPYSLSHLHYPFAHERETNTHFTSLF